MKYIEEEIIKNGEIIGDDILKVDSFLNHQIDVNFAYKVGEYFANEFSNFNKVLTIETSGVAFALTTALHANNCPVVFAKKSKSAIVDINNCYSTFIKSFTRNIVSEVTVDKRFLNKNDKVLIVDDFLAEGSAALGLIDLVKQAGGEVIGVCAVINKAFQKGEEKINSLGIKVVSGARIIAFENQKPIFG